LEIESVTSIDKETVRKFGTFYLYRKKVLSSMRNVKIDKFIKFMKIWRYVFRRYT